MADPYADIANAGDQTQEAIAEALVARSEEDAQIDIRRDYLSRAGIEPGSYAVDLGAGTGHLARQLLDEFGCGRVLGIDPSPVLVDRAKALNAGEPRLQWQMGDARDTGLAADSVDLVTCHTVLCHVPEAERAVTEAFRILRPGGIFAVCDGDYSVSSVALNQADPLQTVLDDFIKSNVHDLWLTRRLPRLLAETGFEGIKMKGHAYIAEGEAPYFMTVVNRGTTALTQRGQLSEDLAQALRDDAAKRIAEGSFFASMNFVSFLATKPGDAS